MRYITCALLMLLCADLKTVCCAETPMARQGMELFDSGEFVLAAEALQKAVASECANDAKVRYYLANSLMRARRYEQARTQFESCLKLNPAEPIARYCHQALAQLNANHGTTIQPAPIPQQVAATPAEPPKYYYSPNKVTPPAREAAEEPLPPFRVFHGSGTSFIQTQYAPGRYATQIILNQPPRPTGWVRTP